MTRKQFLQLMRHQQRYKEAFTAQQAWEAMAACLRTLLEIPTEDREEDDRLLLERLLMLVCNVLWAPAGQMTMPPPTTRCCGPCICLAWQSCSST